MRRLPSGLSTLLLLATLGAQSGGMPAVAEAMAAMVQDLRLRGAGLAVLRHGERLHTSLHGTVAGDTVLPIASASKWLATATVLALVDDGVLDLDAPVGRYVAEFDRPEHAGLSLRHCLACTNGLPVAPAAQRAPDMAAFAAAAAAAGLRGQPGTAFRYGGTGFQVAAVAAERATGKTWHSLFAERIAGPLGMRHTAFGTLAPPGGQPGTAKLPWVAGGAVSTLDDYAAFVDMLLGKGVFAGRRVLSEASVAEMLRDQVPAGAVVAATAMPVPGTRYGLATWLLPIEGTTALRATDPGAFGFTPWLDPDLGIGGVLAVRDRVARVLPALAPVQAAARAAAPREPGKRQVVAATAATIELPHGGLRRRYHLHVPEHERDAALPLLVVLHGGGGNGAQVRDATGLDEIGTRAGFAVAFPDGTGPGRGRLLTWNSGGLPVHAVEHDIDDTGFLRAVVADVGRRAPIDTARVFAAGHSNGGMMCHRLARQAADVFAGIAVVAGAMDFTAADSELPIAVLIVHGTEDQRVRFDGGRPLRSTGRVGERSDASVADAVAYYLTRNGLSPVGEKVVDGRVRTETWSTGKNGGQAPPVRVVTLDGGGHAWPSLAKPRRLLGEAPFPFDASAAIVAFCRDAPPRGR